MTSSAYKLILERDKTTSIVTRVTAVNNDWEPFLHLQKSDALNELEIAFQNIPSDLDTCELKNELRSKFFFRMNIDLRDSFYMTWQNKNHGKKHTMPTSMHYAFDLIESKCTDKTHAQNPEQLHLPDMTQQEYINHLLYVRQKYPEEFADELHLLPKSMRPKKVKEDVLTQVKAEAFPYAADRKKRGHTGVDNTTFEMEQAGHQLYDALRRNKQERIKFPPYQW